MLQRATWTSVLTAATMLGCAGHGQVDLLQARLREQQQELAAAQSRITAVEGELKQARNESARLQAQLAQTGQPGLLPEQSELLARVSGIRINPLLTAGMDRDEVAGDDALVVQFAPYDSDGELVKLPGKIEITVLDPALPDDARTVARWEFTAEQARERWLRGFLGAGYQFTLPWPTPPRHADLVVHVKLSALDGREFTATQVIKITPPVLPASGKSRVAGAAPRRVERLPLPDDDAAAPAVPAPHARQPVVESTNWMEHTLPVRR